MSNQLALKGIQLLLIEDEPDTRDLLVFIFEMEGAVVKTVETMGEALEMLNRCKPDIILSNVQLPDGNGYTLIQEWRNREIERNHVPIPAIAVTGADKAVNEPLALAAGFQSFIQKPLDPDQIVAVVVSVMDEAAITPGATKD